MPTLTPAEHRFAQAAFSKDRSRMSQMPSSLHLQDSQHTSQANVHHAGEDLLANIDQPDQSLRPWPMTSRHRDQIGHQGGAGWHQPGRRAGHAIPDTEARLQSSPAQLASTTLMQNQMWPCRAARHASASSDPASVASSSSRVPGLCQHLSSSDDESADDRNSRHAPDEGQPHGLSVHQTKDPQNGMSARRDMQRPGKHARRRARAPRKAPNVLALSMRVARLPAAIHPASSTGSDNDPESSEGPSGTAWMAAGPPGNIWSPASFSERLQLMTAGKLCTFNQPLVSKYIIACLNGSEIN